MNTLPHTNFLIEEERPEYKCLHLGSAALTDVEVLSMVLRPGSKTTAGLDLARKIYNDFEGDLHRIYTMTVGELLKYKEITKSRALVIRSAFELARRSHFNPNPKETIKDSKGVYQHLYKILYGLSHERFVVLYLNRANKIITSKVIGEGGIDTTYVDRKFIFKYATEYNASSIILGHNHPSGNVRPSEADKDLTNKIAQIGTLLTCPVLDHIIIGTEEKYYSFADEGLI